MPQADLPIGVFDSGVGGLTVLHALENAFPHEDFLYLGDTARLPYGTKSADTIIAYAKQATEILIERGIKLLVVACNTATTAALPALKLDYPNLPIIGMLEPTVKKAVAITHNKKIAVIGTEATIKSHAYQNAILALNPKAHVYAKACGLLVALAEEGLTCGTIPRLVVGHYLHALFVSEMPDTLILGCTHYPLLTEVIKDVTGDQVHIVDSAAPVTVEVQDFLEINACYHSQRILGKREFLVTDDAARFVKFAKQFMGHRILDNHVQLVDL